APPGDGHRLGSDSVRVPAASPPRIGRDGTEMSEDLPEARLGELAIEVDAHAQYCRNEAPTLQVGRAGIERSCKWTFSCSREGTDGGTPCARMVAFDPFERSGPSPVEPANVRRARRG